MALRGLMSAGRCATLRWIVAATMVAMVASGVAAAASQATTLNVWGTSDVTDSDLMAGLIEPGYAAKYPGNTISYTAVGTGAAITAAENPANEIDAIIVHSPPLEAPFVSGGYSYQNMLGYAIFYNQYIIAGPKTDPAGVKSVDSANAVGAFEKIAAAGAAGKATFVSRNDNSGTNVEEQTIWGDVHTVDPPSSGGPLLQLAPNAPAGNTTRYIPWTGTGTGIPAWYVETGVTQGANLIDTNNCNASPPTYSTPYGGCYTIVDQGTYEYQSTQGTPTNTSNLEVVTTSNCATCTGGAGLLTNPFHAYIVKSTMANQPGDLPATEDLISYLTSSTFQTVSLPKFPKSGPEEFYPDAFAQLTSVSIPTSPVAPNSPITIQATLTYPPPIAQPIGGMPVVLQQCTSGASCSSSAPTSCTAGGGWTNNSTANSNATSGVVTFNPTIGTTSTYYRFCMAQYSDSTLASVFSFNADGTELGPNGGYVTVT
jgi:hypothetical protein